MSDTATGHRIVDCWVNIFPAAFAALSARFFQDLKTGLTRWKDDMLKVGDLAEHYTD